MAPINVWFGKPSKDRLYVSGLQKCHIFEKLKELKFLSQTYKKNKTKWTTFM